MQDHEHEVWCRKEQHLPPADESQPWSSCVGGPDARAAGTETQAWLAKDDAGRTIVDLDHSQRQSIQVQAAGEFGIAMALMAERGGAVLAWPDRSAGLPPVQRNSHD